jgi:hypothetical protein
MSFQLFLQAYILFIRSSVRMRFGAFQGIHTMVKHQSVVCHRQDPRIPTDFICQAIDLASALYPFQIRCLQRSAATTVLLRRNGWKAELVIGAQILPLKSHAWVEIDGQVINDKPYMREVYRVLERC